MSILSGKTCPYCLDKTEYVDSKEVYKKSYGMIYLCRKCEAWVGVHKGTDNALGRLANKELREWKKKAHNSFDPLWKRKMEKGFSKKEARTLAYKWLSEQLKIESELTHIGMFDVEDCKMVVDLVNSLKGKRT